MSEHILLEISLIVILGIGAQWLAWRLRLPSIILLLVFGFVAGPVMNLVHPSRLLGDLLFPIVSISVAIILFEGGLTLRFKELPAIGKIVTLLITIGVIISWFFGALGAYYILNLNLQISILLGAILVVTGPTVIGPLLRHIRPSGKVGDILKWEGIVIDPIGALLAVLVFEAILAEAIDHATAMVLLSLGQTILFGSLSGLLFAFLLIVLIKNYWIPDFLQETVAFSMVIASFMLADHFQSESGLFAATLMGIVMANQKYVSVKHILEFKANLSVLIISILFIILSARLQLEVFNIISLNSIIFLALLIVIARPASVFLSSLGMGLTIREKTFLSWMAPRGIVAAAVSSIFALRLMENNIAQAQFLVPVTFIVIIGTVVVYGLTAGPLARRLKLSQSNPQGILFAGAHPWALEIIKVIKDKGFAVAAVDTNRYDINKARMAGIPSYHDSILSEQLSDNLRLSGIGKLLALTSNNEANSMAALRYAEVFESEQLYQLFPAGGAKKDEERYSPKHLRGRFLFGEGVDFHYFNRRFYEGAIVKSTKLSKEFGFQAFLKYYGENTVPLFLITEDKELVVKTTDYEFEPKAGDTIIALVDEAEENNKQNSESA
ncbi:MAG: hypothetical protein GF313_13955 [Caldithrix sp.]|nr:hypothetical protein [Caldithrix sp.]